MPKEIEMKILEVNPAEVRARLRAVGAKLSGRYHFRRIVFDIINNRKRRMWIRLRTDGKLTTLTLKDNRGKGMLGTEEREVTVGDFDETARILAAAMNDALYEENYREEYSLGSTKITIDYNPGLPPLTEIEGKSEDAVNRTFKKLKIRGKPFGNAPASLVYRLYGMDYREVGMKNKKKLKKILSG